MYHIRHWAGKTLCTLECLMVREITSENTIFYGKLGNYDR